MSFYSQGKKKQIYREYLLLQYDSKYPLSNLLLYTINISNI